MHVCDFCQKTQHEVELMVSGKTGDICAECIEIAQEIVDEHRDNSFQEFYDR